MYEELRLAPLPPRKSPIHRILIKHRQKPVIKRSVSEIWRPAAFPPPEKVKGAFLTATALGLIQIRFDKIYNHETTTHTLSSCYSAKNDLERLRGGCRLRCEHKRQSEKATITNHKSLSPSAARGLSRFALRFSKLQKQEAGHHHQRCWRKPVGSFDDDFPITPSSWAKGSFPSVLLRVETLGKLGFRRHAFPFEAQHHHDHQQ